MNKTSQVLIIAAAACWGIVGVFTRPLISAGFSYTEMAAARSFITLACIFIFLLVTDREKLRVNKKDLWMFVCMGGIGFSMFNIVYFQAIHLITLSAACILLYTAPFMVVLISPLVFKDRITLQKICALFVAFTGCVMTVGYIDSSGISLPGVLSGLAAAFCFSQYTIFGKFALKKYHPFTVIVYTFIAALLAVTPFCNIENVIALAGASAYNLANLLAIGFFSTLIPFLCYTKGLEKTEPGRAMIIAFAEPLVASVAGVVVYGEMLSAVKISGMALIFAALVILNLKHSEKISPPKQ